MIVLRWPNSWTNISSETIQLVPRYPVMMITNFTVYHRGVLYVWHPRPWPSRSTVSPVRERMWLTGEIIAFVRSICFSLCQPVVLLAEAHCVGECFSEEHHFLKDSVVDEMLTLFQTGRYLLPQWYVNFSNYNALFDKCNGKQTALRRERDCGCASSKFE